VAERKALSDTPSGQVLTPCSQCTRWRGFGICDAFPDGVPLPIIVGDNLHTEPFPGDGGLLFNPKDDSPVTRP